MLNPITKSLFVFKRLIFDLIDEKDEMIEKVFPCTVVHISICVL